MFNAKPIDCIQLHASDNVCVAVRDLPAGMQISAGGRSVALVESIKLGHKIALAPIAEGASVIKYGQIIGFGTRRHRARCMDPHAQPDGRTV